MAKEPLPNSKSPPSETRRTSETASPGSPSFLKRLWADSPLAVARRILREQLKRYTVVEKASIVLLVLNSARQELLVRYRRKLNQEKKDQQRRRHGLQVANMPKTIEQEALTGASEAVTQAAHSLKQYGFLTLEGHKGARRYRLVAK